MSIIRLTEVDSTNTWLKEHCEELSHGDAVTALRQTQGRGRIGHTWLGSDGMLPMSVLLKSPPEVQTLTLRVSLAVCEALEQIVPEELGIKWPNDIILRRRKLCGILCESVVKCDGVNIICGIGVNLSQPEEYFAAAGIPHGGSVASITGIAPDADRLTQSISSLVARYAQVHFEQVRGDYERRCLTTGREVRLLGREERTVFSEAIADSVCLICRD